MFRYCPACGFVYYHNTAAATGCVISVDDTVLLLIRGKEPSKGKLVLPGVEFRRDSGGFEPPGKGPYLRIRGLEGAGVDFHGEKAGKIAEERRIKIIIPGRIQRKDRPHGAHKFKGKKDIAFFKGPH
ncbi:MAG: hypothetical protein LBS06_05985 [Treponema sp.]|jgi:hypothetical protein|nr:hypothetical protein [Treponema sp.]